MGESVSGETHVARAETPVTGVLRWLSVHDDLLRGLTHTLSNRLGTIFATAYLVELQPAAHQTTAATLRAESDKLEALLQLMRVLPRRAEASAEPVIPTDILQQAIAIAAHHPDAREVRVTVSTEGDLQPAYVEPGHLAMALCVALVHAQGITQRAAAGDAEIAVRVFSDTDIVSLECCATGVANGARHVLSDETTTNEVDVAAVRWLLAPFGGGGDVVAGGIRVFASTLQAARRAQREAAARG